MVADEETVSNDSLAMTSLDSSMVVTSGLENGING